MICGKLRRTAEETASAALNEVSEARLVPPSVQAWDMLKYWLALRQAYGNIHSRRATLVLSRRICNANNEVEFTEKGFADLYFIRSMSYVLSSSFPSFFGNLRWLSGLFTLSPIF